MGCIGLWKWGVDMEDYNGKYVRNEVKEDGRVEKIVHSVSGYKISR